LRKFGVAKKMFKQSIKIKSKKLMRHKNKPKNYRLKFHAEKWEVHSKGRETKSNDIRQTDNFI